MKKYLYKSAFFLALFFAAFTSCQKESFESINLKSESAYSFSGTQSTPVSDSEITPFISEGASNGGNLECNQLFENEEILTSGRLNYADFADDAAFAAAFPQGIQVVITDGKFVAFSTQSNYLVHAVIVKGGNNANVYLYHDGSSSDSGLASPPNASGDPAGLSNLTICYSLVEEPCDWMGETAWSDGPRFVERGNWALYTPFVAEQDIDLIAGQHYLAGTLVFSPVVDGQVTITLTLNEGFRLKQEDGLTVDQAIKVQGYQSGPPAKNPAPGRFNTYKGTELSFTVDAFAYYAIHLDVEREICPE